MSSYQSNINPTIEGAQTFAIAAARLSEGGDIQEITTASGGRIYAYVDPDSDAPKMSISELVATANKISIFARNNVFSKNSEKLSREDLEDLQLGIKNIKERLEIHDNKLNEVTRFCLSLFRNIDYKILLNELKEINYTNKIEKRDALIAAKLFDADHEQMQTKLEHMKLCLTQIDQEEPLPGIEDLNNKEANLSRAHYFKRIVERTGISEERKDIPKFLTYLKKAIWGYFVGNQGDAADYNSSRSTRNHALKDAKKENLEGGNVVAHLFYLYNHLELESNDDPNISKLKDDIERSLPFAFELDFLRLGLYSTEERKANLSAKIHDTLLEMKPGQSLFLPIGCIGHATLLVMTKKENECVEFQHINTGFGLDEHRNLVGKEGGVPIAVSLTVDLNKRDSENHIKTGLVKFINSSLERKTMEDVTQGLRDLNRNVGIPGGRITASVRRKKGQQVKNCSHRCLLEGFRDRLGIESYRKFKAGLMKKLKDDYRTHTSEDTEVIVVEELAKIKARVKKRMAE